MVSLYFPPHAALIRQQRMGPFTFLKPQSDVALVQLFSGSSPDGEQQEGAERLQVPALLNH